MEKQIYNKDAQNTLDILARGAFLTTQAEGKLNTMTIGWGSIGHIWQKPVFMVMVRPSRFTYDLIEQSGEFTVSIPHEDMQMQLGFCGVKSGRKTDKFAALNLATFASQKIATPAIKIKGLHYECKVLYKTTMLPAQLDAAVNEKAYPEADYHVMYFGEILNTVKL